MQQLNRNTLRQLPSTVLHNKTALNSEIGIVHLGPGAFHRAHQAVFTDNAMEYGGNWCICGVSMRSSGVRDELASQDNLYTLAVLDENPSYQLISAIKQILVLSEQRSLVMQQLTAATTHIISLTITEKGYCLTSDGLLDLAHPDIKHDLANPEIPCSAIGLLVTALAFRHQECTAELTIISCDNLADNGTKLAKAIIAFATHVDPVLAAWIKQTISFPNTMVDSITPATNEALRARVAQAIQLQDNWPIQREAFTQWVIEDNFSGPRPAWEKVGVTFTSDVSAYEKAKLRLLNGSHSTLAYLGLLCGKETVNEAISHPTLFKLIETLLKEQVSLSFSAPAEMNVDQYIDAILLRYNNRHIRHLLSQIAWDGSQKLPFRLLGSIQDNLAQGQPISLLCIGVAAWLQFLVSAAQTNFPLVDPLADKLIRCAALCDGKSKEDVTRLLGIEQVFPTPLVNNTVFIDGICHAYLGLSRLNADNVTETLEAFL
ncbi:mannitol dehydrogenase family protein [Paraglaciecola sp. 25GB23A]|uniref:mannitol dehydrogenase family protein n=1 Tax=Paraglaciecola sp. 25GB23A TaxID=3156068 RepID=UPI0032AEAC85